MAKQSWQQWARACGADPSSPSKLFKGALGALTGQDARALNAIVACWELYASSDDDGQRGALEAIRALLPAMQGGTRWIARELIPYALDWDDRERLWPLVAPKNWVVCWCDPETGNDDVEAEFASREDAERHLASVRDGSISPLRYSVRQIVAVLP